MLKNELKSKSIT